MKPVILSHWTEDPPVVVKEPFNEYLENYHLHQLRFLYNNRNKGRGTILNCHKDMLCYITVAAFLSTLSHLKISVLILTNEEALPYWKHFMNMIPQVSIDYEELVSITNAEGMTIIVRRDMSNISLDVEYSVVVVDEIDTYPNVKHFNKKLGIFHIGITYRNFFESGNEDLFVKILNWSSPGLIKNQKIIAKKYKRCLTRRINPYTLSWLKLSWDFCELFQKPKNYKDIMRDVQKNDSSLQQSVEICNNVTLKHGNIYNTNKSSKDYINKIPIYNSIIQSDTKHDNLELCNCKDDSDHEKESHHAIDSPSVQEVDDTKAFSDSYLISQENNITSNVIDNYNSTSEENSILDGIIASSTYTHAENNAHASSSSSANTADIVLLKNETTSKSEGCDIIDSIIYGTLTSDTSVSSERGNFHNYDSEEDSVLFTLF